MPSYNFKCNSCDHLLEVNMGVAALIEYKRDNLSCTECQDGYFIQQVISFGSKIERSMDQFNMTAAEEVREIVSKIKAGDQELIKNIYGEEANPYKQ